MGCLLLLGGRYKIFPPTLGLYHSIPNQFAEFSPPLPSSLYCASGPGMSNQFVFLFTTFLSSPRFSFETCQDGSYSRESEMNEYVSTMCFSFYHFKACCI